MKYEIIDSHSHIFPDKIAEKASNSIGNFYSLAMSSKGTTSSLLEQGKAAGISRFVVHSTATAPKQVKDINRYIINQCNTHPELIGYMTLHPDMSECEIIDEMSYCINNGIKGIKLHPDFQAFNIDDPRAMKIYYNAQGVLPILFHTGDKRYEYSKPIRLARVARDFPKLTVIGAHFGGYSRWDETHCYKGLKNVYMDTSSSLMFMSPLEAKKFIDYFGAEWFFFGVDYPMWRADEELERFMAIPLTEEQRKMILADNFKFTILRE